MIYEALECAYSLGQQSLKNTPYGVAKVLLEKMVETHKIPIKILNDAFFKGFHGESLNSNTSIKSKRDLCIDIAQKMLRTYPWYAGVCVDSLPATDDEITNISETVDTLFLDTCFYDAPFDERNGFMIC